MPGVSMSGDRGRSGSSEAHSLFLTIAEQLDSGSGDPEEVIRSRPDLEPELRRLHRDWLAADFALQGLASSVCDDGVFDPVAESDLRVALQELRRNDFGDRYELAAEVGRGGMGVVLRVRDRVLDRDLAMKVLRSVKPHQLTRFAARFLTEAKILARLVHPGIVAIHEVGLDPQGALYFTMPLLSGRTLQEVLTASRERESKWSLLRVLDVLSRACDAVAFAHSRGVLHRDLKPANVMVGAFGEVHVMDWGLARSAQSLEVAGGVRIPATGATTLAGAVLGTPAYMAPEQATGSALLDGRCDVYALGAILYELLAGVRPYGDCDSITALRRLRAGPPEPIERHAPAADAELVAIAQRAMARDREQRYGSVEALAADLRAYREGRVVSAHGHGAWTEARKWIRRNRALAGALAAAAMALKIGLIVSLLLWSSAERERGNVLRLAQSRTLAELTERAVGLWPALPRNIAAMRTWRNDAARLVARLDPDPMTGETGLREQLAELQSRGPESDPATVWWESLLARLVGDIEELADPTAGLMGSGIGSAGFGIGRRLLDAERIERQMAVPEVVAAWRLAISQIADDPRFGGMQLAVQEGLVPLGRDPQTGLQEFAHLLSGDVPQRGPDGALRLEPASAIVLVLVPGGDFRMGSQVDDREAPNFALAMGKFEYPVHWRHLPAFFIGKHEVTESQWSRIDGHNPSYWVTEPGSQLLPVETITWFVADAVTRRVDLRLPTEAEWEYACRAGSTTEFFWGPEPSGVVRFGNVKDLDRWAYDPATDPTVKSIWYQYAAEPDAEQGSLRIEVHDGYRDLSPVGAKLPNAFGLFDVIGNVFEWCADELQAYPGAEGAPFPMPPVPRGQRVFRGGAYHRTSLRPGDRGYEDPNFAYRAIGVRAARSVDP